MNSEKDSGGDPVIGETFKLEVGQSRTQKANLESGDTAGNTGLLPFLTRASGRGTCCQGARRAHLRSHSGRNAGAALARCSTSPEKTIPPHTDSGADVTATAETEARCEGCHAQLDAYGRHRASCPRSGRVKKPYRPPGFHKMAAGSPNAHFVWNSAWNRAHNSTNRPPKEGRKNIGGGRKQKSEILGGPGEGFLGEVGRRRSGGGEGSGRRRFHPSPLSPPPPCSIKGGRLRTGRELRRVSSKGVFEGRRRRGLRGLREEGLQTIRLLTHAKARGAFVHALPGGADVGAMWGRACSLSHVPLLLLRRWLNPRSTSHGVERVVRRLCWPTCTSRPPGGTVCLMGRW